MLTAAYALLVAAQAWHPPVTPYARHDRLEIHVTKVSRPTLPRLETEEIFVDARGTYDNPFDPSEVTLDAKVIPPSGKPYEVPGFFYRPYERKEESGVEKLSPAGDGQWIVRIAPLEEGSHRVELTFKDRTGKVFAPGVNFVATSATAPGMVHVSPRDRRYFEYEDGKSFYPVGANVCWGGDRGTFSYDDWFPNYGKVGANFARLWLGPSWTTFGMETPGKPEEGHGVGQIDLANAWRLDYVVDLARKNGLFLQLCLDSYNELRSGDNFPWWEKTPQNVDNGGPLRVWSDFWTNPTMDGLYRAKLRYLVARYGSYANVFAWELWNEVDLTQDFNPDNVRDWHRRMATALHTIDPYHHPVTTSVSNTMGLRDLELIPELDFFQTHHYGSPDLAAAVVAQQSRKAWGRPHLFGEIGADASGPRDKDDPTGLQIHDPIWASIAVGVSGTASPWWWDSLIAPKNLYPLFGAAAKFVQGIDWPGEAFQFNDLSFAYLDQPKTRPRRNLVLEDGPVEWKDGPSNRPKVVRVTGSGVSGPLPLPGVQHGTRNHPSWHNPVLFKVNLPRPTRFEVIVGDVSGYGGAILRVELDGERVMTREFSDPDDARDPATLTKYAGRYGLLVPAGNHVIRVENVGNDWFTVGYRFLDLIPRTKPPVDGWAIVGNDVVLGWFRPEGRNWRRMAVLKETVNPAPATVVGLAGLASGSWRVEYWDTQKGTITGSTSIRVPLTGKIRIPLPPIKTDLALKAVRVKK